MTSLRLRVWVMLPFLAAPLMAPPQQGPAPSAEPACDELNTLYRDRYIDDFSIDRVSFGIDPDAADIFTCGGRDRNFMLARAINDLDRLSRVPGVEDYYGEVARLMSAPGRSLAYDRDISVFPDVTARTFRGERMQVVLLDGYLVSPERLRPTYVLVHEAFHTRSDDPGHVVCARGTRRGRRVCDTVLGPEDVLRAGSGVSREFLFLDWVRHNPAASTLMKQEAEKQMRYLAGAMFNDVGDGMLHHYGLD